MSQWMYFSGVAHRISNTPFNPIFSSFRVVRIVSLFILFFSFLVNCSSQRALTHGSHKPLIRIWDSLDLAANHHIGLAIYDVKKEKYIFEHQSSHLFTPASNTKLLTMYAALLSLGDSIPAAYYQERGDTIILWGGGDPGTKYPDIKSESRLINYIKDLSKTIVFSDHHFQTERYGSGWAWDDYTNSYQPERTAFPVYGNRVWVERFRDSIAVTPSYFHLVLTSERSNAEKLIRDENGTTYHYRYNTKFPQFTLSTAASLYQNDIRSIWEDETGKQITFRDAPFPVAPRAINGTPRDTMLKLMMHESDNFVAEQLLLASSLRRIGVMDEEKFIEELMKTDLLRMQDSVTWVDASGLSRYNLFSPRSLVFVLEKIIELKGIEYVKSILPTGGEHGTVSNFFKGGKDGSYIYAKTGALRNVFCLTGILITKSDKVLLFSWMNNHFKNSDRAKIISDMERLLISLRNNY